MRRGRNHAAGELLLRAVLHLVARGKDAALTLACRGERLVLVLVLVLLVLVLVLLLLVLLLLLLQDHARLLLVLLLRRPRRRGERAGGGVETPSAIATPQPHHCVPTHLVHASRATEPEVSLSQSEYSASKKQDEAAPWRETRSATKTRTLLEVTAPPFAATFDTRLCRLLLLGRLHEKQAEASRGRRVSPTHAAHTHLEQPCGLFPKSLVRYDSRGGMQQDSSSSNNTADASRPPSEQQQLLARLADTESLLAAERASKQALCDELLRLRSESNVGSAATGGSAGRQEHNGGVSAAPPAEAAEASAERAGRRRRGEEERPRPPWQNVLYKRQPYADNHVPDSFLEKLVTNGEDVSNILIQRFAPSGYSRTLCAVCASRAALTRYVATPVERDADAKHAPAARPLLRHQVGGVRRGRDLQDTEMHEQQSVLRDSWEMTCVPVPLCCCCSIDARISHTQFSRGCTSRGRMYPVWQEVVAGVLNLLTYLVPLVWYIPFGVGEAGREGLWALALGQRARSAPCVTKKGAQWGRCLLSKKDVTIGEQVLNFPRTWSYVFRVIFGLSHLPPRPAPLAVQRTFASPTCGCTSSTPSP